MRGRTAVLHSIALLSRASEIDSPRRGAYLEPMSSSAVTFDRLTYIDRLKEAGIEERAARAHAEALDAALRDSVATKGDVDAVRRELKETELRLDAKIETVGAALKVDILRWLVVTQLALGGFIFAVLKFLR